MQATTCTMHRCAQVDPARLWGTSGMNSHGQQCMCANPVPSHRCPDWHLERMSVLQCLDA
eukprot:8664613-Alexandrium_andersonii.AAC.1